MLNYDAATADTASTKPDGAGVPTVISAVDMLLAGGDCNAAHQHALHLLWPGSRPEMPVTVGPGRSPVPIDDVQRLELLTATLGCLALCDWRASILPVLRAHVRLLPEIGSRVRDHAVGRIIAVISDPRARTQHRPSCRCPANGSGPRWATIRVTIMQLEYRDDLPLPDAAPRNPAHQQPGACGPTQALISTAGEHIPMPTAPQTRRNPLR